MAFRWRADDGPTFNAGLVVLRISRDPAKKFYIFVISRDPAKKFYIFVIFWGGDLLSPSGSAHGTGQCIHLLRYTENPFYRAHQLLYDTLRTFYRMHNVLN